MRWTPLSFLVSCLLVLATRLRNDTKSSYSTMSGNFPWTIGPVGDTLRFSTNAALLTAELTINGLLNRVGINQVAPTQSLDVAGTVRVSGAATLGSTLGVAGALTASSNIAVAATVASAVDSQNAQCVMCLRGAINPSESMTIGIPAGLYVTATATPSSGSTQYATGMFIDSFTTSGVTNAASLYVRAPLAGTNRYGVVTNGRMGINTQFPANWLQVSGSMSTNIANHVSQSGGYMNMTTNPSGALSASGVPSALYVRAEVSAGTGLTQTLVGTVHAAMNSGSGTQTTTATVIARIPTAGNNRYAILTTGHLVVSGNNGHVAVRQASGTAAGDLCAGSVAMGSADTTVTVTTTCVGANDLIFITKRTAGAFEHSISSVTPGESFTFILSTSIQATFDWMIIKEAPTFT